jgi:AraC-like DNA-binding protein
MKPREHPRCAQCRKRFVPHPAAREKQRVCGPACRALRDNALARDRRALDLDEAREDERLRQRKHRAAARTPVAAPAPAPDPPPRHAPTSDGKPSKLREKILEVWDEEAALSRARLQRRFARILGQSEADSGTEPPVSRARLGAQTPSPQGFA